jgi:hypothetical protein
MNKSSLCFSLILLAAGPLLAADSSSPKNDVTTAVTALGNQSNYSWRTTVDLGPNSPFQPGPTDGKTEKAGYTWLSLSFNDNATLVVIQGAKVAIKSPDQGWQTADEAAQADGGAPGPLRFIARMAKDFKVPAAEASNLVAQATNLVAGTNGVSGALTEDAVKTFLTFRRGGNGAPPVANAKGSVTFWLADGKLVKYESHVSGKININGEDRDIDRTSTTEIKDVGATKIEVPEAAKKKLE